MNGKYAQKLSSILHLVKNYDYDVVEASVIDYISRVINKPFSYDQSLVNYENKSNTDLVKSFLSMKFPVSIEFIIEFFEALLKKETINENGIVFTPKYISDFICSSTFEQNNSFLDACKIIDAKGSVSIRLCDCETGLKTA